MTRRGRERTENLPRGFAHRRHQKICPFRGSILVGAGGGVAQGDNRQIHPFTRDMSFHKV